jgi:hypothetical protein
MSIATTRNQVELEIAAADRTIKAAYKRLGLDKLNRKWIRAGVWEMKGRDGKWRTVKLKKAKPVKVNNRFASGKRDTAKPEIKEAGKPGTDSRIAAMAAHYQNPLNEGVSAFDISDMEIAEGLAGLLLANIKHASYDVDAINEFVPEE